MTKRALISVSNKTGLIELAKVLIDNGVEILSTGGTAAYLRAQHLPLRDVAEYTQFPEIMQGRVKTLHPKVHGGILARLPEDNAIMQQLGIDTIDYVIVNLYPFQETITKEGCTPQEAIENIDIGGPTLIRAAAKNNERVAVFVAPSDYPLLIEALQRKTSLSPADRWQLAGKAFFHTAAYDRLIADYFLQDKKSENILPTTLHFSLEQKNSLRYGENSHQQAGLYVTAGNHGNDTLAMSPLLQGKALSYNNLADSDAAWACLIALGTDKKACVIVKHANPCGVAKADSLTQAYQKAYAADSTSAFGGIIALNDTLDSALAQTILEQQFVEVILAPHFEAAALALLQKKPNIRCLQVALRAQRPSYELKAISGGYLVQTVDTPLWPNDTMKVVTTLSPTAEQWQDLKFAWGVAKYVKSNAIVYAAHEQTLGIGAGQMSRIDSARIAALKAKDAQFSLQGAVMASDAFFPFSDSLESAHAAGITAIIQPGGAMRDEEIIARANELKLAMVFTGMRHFKH
ncbi:MAG: purH [Gammaproteobacteria bacterium]|jgi:phosphoribosylaminoimidazolecarboxamide formyltransferase/IMP cyclohydrolase|nr:purH [Gammaproteobacteria bacterium]